MKRLLLTLSALLCITVAAQAQTDAPVTEEEEFYGDEELYDFDDEQFLQEYGLGNGLGLGVYGGLYYLTGYSDKTGTSRQSDFNDKFNIGLKYTLYDDEWFTMLVKYEQTSFWEIYQAAKPISETVFSPGAELTLKLNPDSRIVMGAEMRFNGAADSYARRLNYFRIALYRDFRLRSNAYFSAALQTGVGRGHVETVSSIRDYYRYNGYFTFGAWFQSASEGIKCRLKVTPYDHFNHCGVQVDLHYRPSYSMVDRFYYMIQYGYGLEQQHQFLPHGQSLLPQHYIRFGISYCPEFTL